jgi:hypothetical protein
MVTPAGTYSCAPACIASRRPRLDPTLSIFFNRDARAEPTTPPARLPCSARHSRCAIPARPGSTTNRATLLIGACTDVTWLNENNSVIHC